ncbi:MAG: ATP-binding cassette domain-containing protein [Proteobacteria bacterium]|nr:ATP-binding cassette domain-containing protein [Pseudomonadota bacterium]
MPAAQFVALRDMTFSYDSSPDPLFIGLNAHFDIGFTGVIGANGAGKTTLMKIVCGLLVPDSGSIQGADHAIYCAQRTDRPPAGLDEFLLDYDGDACTVRGRLGIEHDFGQRWDSLSHGERKRTQIGCALWQQPSLLAIDEPTNHIDAGARLMLIDSLRAFRGIGLIVSHDRDLLDELCQQCVWLTPPSARTFPGGYSLASKQRQLDRETTQREHDQAARENNLLQQERIKRRELASRAHADRSKRGLGRKDHDAKAKIDAAIVSGKDGQAGRLLRQLDGRAERAQERLADARVDKEYEIGIWLPGSVSRRHHLLHLAPDKIPLGGDRTLSFPQLHIGPADRIAITGANGLGKSTLVRHIMTCANVPPQHLTIMPQEVDAELSRQILDQARALPKESLGQVMNIVSRLGSRPQRLLDSREPSPGEVRKLLLALGMARLPHLIVMDEPTNHLDLPSIEALEAALMDCPCGLLLVSHDERFLSGLTGQRWRISSARDGNSELNIELE